MNQNGQRQTEREYRVPAGLMSLLLAIASRAESGMRIQVEGGGYVVAGRVYADAIELVQAQNQEMQTRRVAAASPAEEPVEEQGEDNYTPTPQPSEFQ